MAEESLLTQVVESSILRHFQLFERAKSSRSYEKVQDYDDDEKLQELQDYDDDEKLHEFQESDDDALRFHSSTMGSPPPLISCGCIGGPARAGWHQGLLCKFGSQILATSALIFLCLVLPSWLVHSQHSHSNTHAEKSTTSEP